MNIRLTLAFLFSVSLASSTAQVTKKHTVHFYDISGFTGHLTLEINSSGYFFEPYFTARQKDVVITGYMDGKYNEQLKKQGISFPYSAAKAGRFDFSAQVVLHDERSVIESVFVKFNTTDNLGSGHTFPPFSKYSKEWLKNKGKEKSVVGKEISGGQEGWQIYGRVENIKVTAVFLTDIMNLFDAAVRKQQAAVKEQQAGLSALLKKAAVAAGNYEFAEAEQLVAQASKSPASNDMNREIDETKKLITRKKEEKKKKDELAKKQQEEEDKKKAEQTAQEEEEQAKSEVAAAGGGSSKTSGKSAPKTKKDKEEKKPSKPKVVYFPKTNTQLYAELKTATERNPGMLNNPVIRKQLRDYKILADRESYNKTMYKIGAYNPGSYSSASYSQTMGKIAQSNYRMDVTASLVGDLTDMAAGIVNSAIAEKNRKEAAEIAEKKRKNAYNQNKKRALTEYHEKLEEDRYKYLQKVQKEIEKDYKIRMRVDDLTIEYETELAKTSRERGLYFEKGKRSLGNARQLYIVERDGKYGILLDNGGVMYPPQFDAVYAYEDKYWRPRFLIRIKDKWGEILYDGSIVEDVQYDAIWYQQGNRKIMKLGDQWTIKTFNTKEQVQPTTITASELPDNIDGELIAIMNLPDEKLGGTQQWGSGKEELFMTPAGDYYSVNEHEKRKGVRKPVFYWNNPGTGNYGSIVSKLFKVNDAWYENRYDNKTGERTLTASREKFLLPFCVPHPDSVKYKTIWTWGIINEKGKVIVPAIHEWIKPYNEGLAATEKGHYNTEGKLIIDTKDKYKYLSDFKNGYAFYYNGRYEIGKTMQLSSYRLAKYVDEKKLRAGETDQFVENIGVINLNGEMVYEVKNVRKGIDIYRTLAQNAPDTQQALHWYRMIPAPEPQNMQTGQYRFILGEIADIYYKAKDYPNARLYYNAMAMLNWNGYFQKIKKNQYAKYSLEREREIYRKATKKLGDLFSSKAPDKPNYAAAIHWYTISLKRGNEDAFVPMADLAGLTGDLNAVKEGYKQLVNEAPSVRKSPYYKSYRDGIISYYKKEYAKAFKSFKKAADLNFAPAQLMIGKMYEQGQGVAANPDMAANWYQKAANNN